MTSPYKTMSDESDRSDRIDIVSLFQPDAFGPVSDMSDKADNDCPTSPTGLDRRRTENSQSNQWCPTCPTCPTQNGNAGEDEPDMNAPYRRSVAGRPLTPTGGIVDGSHPGQSLADALAKPPPPVARTPAAIEAIRDAAIDRARRIEAERQWELDEHRTHENPHMPVQETEGAVHTPGSRELPTHPPLCFVCGLADWTVALSQPDDRKMHVLCAQSVAAL